MKRCWECTVALITCVPSCLGHQAILPAPRQLSEGSGRFPLRGARICLAAKPSPEDRFAARELASYLAASGRVTLPVVESGCGNKSIVLSRTGQGGDLAAPGETAGEDSREAYSIKISPSAVRVESRASAGIF